MKKKPYEKPKFIYERTLEALAAVCSPSGPAGYTGHGFCKQGGSCAGCISAS
jgi:hypothetical protein